MNRENIQKLIDQLGTLKHVPNFGSEPPEQAFNMNYYFFARRDEKDCGTPACLAGWSCALSEPEDEKKWAGVHDTKILMHAASWLGLDYVWAVDNLFCPIDLDIEFDQLTPIEAKAALERLLRVGESYRMLTCRELWGFED